MRNQFQDQRHQINFQQPNRKLTFPSTNRHFTYRPFAPPRSPRHPPTSFRREGRSARAFPTEERPFCCRSCSVIIIVDAARSGVSLRFPAAPTSPPRGVWTSRRRDTRDSGEQAGVGKGALDRRSSSPGVSRPAGYKVINTYLLLRGLGVF